MDFGPNVHVFDASMSISEIQEQIDSVHQSQAHAEFSDERYATVQAGFDAMGGQGAVLFGEKGYITLNLIPENGQVNVILGINEPAE